MVDSIVWKYHSPYDNSQPEISLDTDNVPQFEGCSIVPLVGKRGFLLPPVTLRTDRIPQRPGNVLRERVVDPRTLDIPFRISAPDYTQLVALQRYLSEALFLTSGSLIFNFAKKKRELVRCTYVDGHLGDDNDDNQFVVWANMMLSFEAHDPYFYGFTESDYITVTNAVLDESAIPKLLDDNFLDNMLGPGRFGESWEIFNFGADTAWGVWTIQGPADSGLSVGRVGGSKFIINKRIYDGEIVTVDTTPGVKTVTSSIEGDIFSKLSNTSLLWGFPKGKSKVKLDFMGISAETKVSCSARIPYPTM